MVREKRKVEYERAFQKLQKLHRTESSSEDLNVRILENPTPTLREKCSYSELFWSTFSRIRTEYEEILRISRYSVQMRENADQNNSEYDTFYAVQNLVIKYKIFILG